jgi:hypothetical protein
MGTWGSGIYENDQAMDTLAEEIDLFARDLEGVLREEDVGWSEIEARLVLVRVYAQIGAEVTLPVITRELVSSWCSSFVELSSKGAGPAETERRRRTVRGAFEQMSRVRFRA